MQRSAEQAGDEAGRHSGHEPLYQVSEVAELLRVSKQTIYRAINDGELPAVRIRRRRLVPESAVTAVLQGTMAVGGTGPNASVAAGESPAATTRTPVE